MKALSQRNHVNACKDLSACIQHWFINKVDPDLSFVRSFGNMDFKGNKVTLHEIFELQTGPRPYDKCTLNIQLQFLVKSNGTLLKNVYITSKDYRGEKYVIYKRWSDGLPLLQKIAKGETTGWVAKDYLKFAYPQDCPYPIQVIRTQAQLKKLRTKFKVLSNVPPMQPLPLI
jgi:hypothetical protein